MEVDLREGLAEIEALLERYAETGDPAQVTAVDVGERVDALADAAGTALAPGVIPDLTPLKVIGAVGRFYLARGQALAAPGDDHHPDLAQAYSYLRWLVGIAPAVVPPDLCRDLILDITDGEADELAGIAAAALTLGQETRDRELVDHGVRILEALAADPSIDDDAREMASTNLTDALRLRWELFGDPDGAPAAEDPVRDADKPLGQSRAAQLRYADTGDPAVLDEAVRAGRAAVEAQPEPGPERATALDNLSNVLRMRFQLARDGADIDEAVRHSRAALELTGPGDPNRSPYLNNLSVALQLRSIHQDDEGPLDEALRSAAQAVRTSRGNRRARDNALRTLAMGIRLASERHATGDPARDSAYLEELLSGVPDDDVAALNALLGQ